jgi:type I restriction enzyme R subunit
LQFDRERYHLERFVIMPNHIHLLVQMRCGRSSRQQCESWMRFTGRRINKLTGKSGEFWSEPFDHIVRNESQFRYLQEYIVQNPAKAGLADGEYLLWLSPPSHDSPSRDTAAPTPTRSPRQIP